MKVVVSWAKSLPLRWSKLCFLAFLVVATVVLARYFRRSNYNEIKFTTTSTSKQEHLLFHVSKQTNFTKSTLSIEATTTWNPESNRRLEHIAKVCKSYEITALRRVWTMATNKDKSGRAVPCNNKMCPMVVDPTNLFFYCFVPRVASASIKEVFVRSQNLTTSRDYLNEEIPDASVKLLSALRSLFQKEADDVLQRVSAMYFPEYIMRRFYKFLFVRHPFERLLSAFLSINEKNLEERRYYYVKYWTSFKPPLINKMAGSPYDVNSVVDDVNYLTFKQFVHYLLNTHPVYYDELWQPYWTRCNICQLQYDFVGKVESANQDFAFVLQAMELNQSLAEQLSVFFRKNAKRKSVSFEKTVKYFKENLEETEILKLYETYFLDFKLFGYDVSEFISEKNITAVDANVKLDRVSPLCSILSYRLRRTQYIVHLAEENPGTFPVIRPRKILI